MDETDSINAQINEEKKNVANEEKIFTEKKNEIEKEIKVIEEKSKQLETQRKQIIPNINEQYFSRYEKILENKQVYCKR